MIDTAQDLSGVSAFWHRLGHSASPFLLTASDFGKTPVKNDEGSYDPEDTPYILHTGINRLGIQGSKNSRISKNKQKQNPKPEYKKIMTTLI